MYMVNVENYIPRPQRAVRMGLLPNVRREQESIGMKRCSKCGIEKDESAFHKRHDGLSSWCKDCVYDYHHKKHRRNCIRCGNEVEKYQSKYCVHCAAMIRGKKGDACSIIKRHHTMMKEDPERLTTEFMQKITGRKC